MGSNETATATTGGPRVIDVFAGNGAPSGPNYLLLSDIDRLSDAFWDSSGVIGPLDRLRRCLGLPRELWIEIFGKSWSRALERKGPCLYVCTDGSARACSVGDCTCIVPALSDPRETSGPRIDRIQPARPPSSISRIKKINFFGPQEVSH